MSYTKNGFLATGVGGTTNGLAVATKYRPTSAGDVTISSTSYVDVDTTLDMTIPAKAGDYIGLGVDFIVTTASTGAATFFDFVTLVNGSTVSYASGNGAGGDGIIAWRVQYAPSGNNVNWPLGPEFIYQVASGDVSGGYVTFRFKTKMSSGTSVISLGTTRNLGVYAKNLSTPASAGNVYGSPSINKPQGTQQRQYTFDTDTQGFTTDTGSLTTMFQRLQITSASGSNASVLEPSAAANIADGEIWADVYPNTPDGTGLYDLGLIFRATDANNHYMMAFRQGGSSSSSEMQLYKKVGGTYTGLAATPTGSATFNAPLALPVASQSRVMVRFAGPSISLYYNETFVLGFYDTTYTTGRIGVRAAGGGVVQYDNITATTLPSGWNPALYTPQSAAAAPQYQVPTLSQINYCEVTGSGTPNMTGQTFSNVLPFDTIISDPGSNYSTANKWYTVPATGTYQITMQFRCDAAGGANVGFAVATSNTDTTATVWRQDAAGGGGRHTYNYSHVGKYNAGDQLRAIAYIDQAGSFAFGGGYMAIEQLATAAPVAVQSQQSWQTVTSFSNSWAAYGGGGGYGPPSFYLDTAGTVHLRGLISGGTTTDGTTMFTLPVGYRPEFAGVFSVIAGRSGGNTDARLDVKPDGTVQVQNTANALTSSFLSLDGVTFRQFG